MAWRWQPETLGELTAPTPSGWGAWQAWFEFLLLDAATLTAEDRRTNPVALLLRLLAGPWAESLPTMAKTLFEQLRYMEEPTMLAEAITEWRQNAIVEGTSEGRRTLLRRQATRRHGLEVGDAFGRLLADEQDADRLALAGDLVIDCSSAEELLSRGRRLLRSGDGDAG